MSSSKKDKLRMDLIPPEADEALAEVFQFGAEKHGERQWEDNPWSFDSILAAAKRHLLACQTGESKDQESGLSHLKHALACLAMLVTYEKRELSKKTSSEKVFIEFHRVRRVRMPERAPGKSAGIDFFVPDDALAPVWRVQPGSSVVIPSGIVAKIPEGYFLLACNRSSVSTNWGLVVGANVIDEDYRGEIHLHLLNTSKNTVEIPGGMKAVQFVLLPSVLMEIREALEEIPRDTARGANGFGSSDGGKRC